MFFKLTLDYAETRYTCCQTCVVTIAVEEYQTLSSMNTQTNAWQPEVILNHYPLNYELNLKCFPKYGTEMILALAASEYE